MVGFDHYADRSMPVADFLFVMHACREVITHDRCCAFGFSSFRLKSS